MTDSGAGDDAQEIAANALLRLANEPAGDA